MDTGRRCPAIGLGLLPVGIPARRRLGRSTLASLVFLAVLLAGCTSLKPVSDFGKAASAVAGYPEVARDYPAILERLRLYGFTGASVDDTQVRRRRDDARRLRDAQDALADYARALGALAADDVVTFDRNLEALNQSLIKAGVATKKETDGYARSVKLGVRWVTDAIRRRQIRRLVRTYDAAVQSLCTSVSSAVADGYVTSIESERAAFDQLVAGRAGASVREKGLDGVPELVAVLAAGHREALEVRASAARSLARGVRQFAEGHRAMAAGTASPRFRHLVETAGRYASELNDILDAFRK